MSIINLKGTHQGAFRFRFIGGTLNRIIKIDADRANELNRAIMEWLELTLHPIKTYIVGLWAGEEGFDFRGMHHRKPKAEKFSLVVAL
ncbi:hypothetical protein O9H85_34380 [Paenibacillus filicis]|uniref:Uncharacterized protein n=1 Tax=Paenibacillus gyeongsangnamensis TaxID=3388067 RepID=A0ABT4QKH6_9BACL|nr:hypothetical protein [Paenibacillus filicis]MCZ8517349.1 hypothetical protein [Paenibacillus filicis]